MLERIRAEGPLSALDFERERGPTTDWFGMPTNTVRAVLERYAVTGVLGLARRDGNRRYYDLLERLLPAAVLAHEIPQREQFRHKLLSRYRAHGLLGAGAGGGDIFGGLGFAKPDPRLPGYPGRHALRDELVAQGDLVPVEIEGLRGKRLVLAEEVDLLDAPPEPPPSVAFLPPSTRWSGTVPSGACSISTTCGSSSCRPPSAAGAGTCCRSRSATASWGASSRESTVPASGRDPRHLVGGRLRAGSRRRIRRRDARRAPRLSVFRPRGTRRVGPTSPRGEASVSHPPVSERTTPIGSAGRGTHRLQGERKDWENMPPTDRPNGKAAAANITKRIQELGDWRGETLTHIRQLIHDADPDIEEEWKWEKPTSGGTPVWSHDGGVCTGEAYKQVVKLTSFAGPPSKTRRSSSIPASKGTRGARSTSAKARRSTKLRSSS